MHVECDGGNITMLHGLVESGAVCCLVVGCGDW